MDDLSDKMMTAIESMRGRKKYGGESLSRDSRWKHYGFVWGILWVAHRLGPKYEEVEKKASQIMKEIKEELDI